MWQWWQWRWQPKWTELMSIVCVCAGKSPMKAHTPAMKNQRQKRRRRRGRYQPRENWIEKVVASEAGASRGHGTLSRDGIYFNAIKIDSAKRISQIGLMSFVLFVFVSPLSVDAHMVGWRTPRLPTDARFIAYLFSFRFKHEPADTLPSNNIQFDDFWADDGPLRFTLNWCKT